MKDLSWLRSLPGNPLVVAEIKQRSPFNGWSNALSVHDQLDLCERYGDIVSIHTDERWGGSWHHLATMCRFWAKKPVLAKGFHNTVHDVKRALDCGATYVLTVGWDGGPYRDHCWFEIENRNDLINTQCKWIVVNSRNPRTGEKQVNVDLQAAKLATSVDRLHHRLCQASHIRGPEDVVPGMDAILIGQGLYE